MAKTFEGCEKEEEIQIYGMPCFSQKNGYDCMLYFSYCMGVLSFGTQKKDTNISKKYIFKPSIVESIELIIAANIQKKIGNRAS